jgi:hypothetical protein
MAQYPAEPEITVARRFAAGTLMREPAEAQATTAPARQESLQGRGDR